MSKQRINDLKVEMSFVTLTERPDKLMSDMPRGTRHYFVTLTRNNEIVTVLYSMGPAHTKGPRIQELLECMVSDALAARDDSFEDFCSNMGYDSDSRKAYRIYKACEEQAKKIDKLFPELQLEEIYEMFTEE